MTSIVQPPTGILPLNPLSAKLISYVESDIACQRLIIEAVKQLDCVRLIHEISCKVVRPDGIYILGVFGKPEAMKAVEGMLTLLPQYRDATDLSETFRSATIGDRIGNVCIGVAYNPPT